MHKRYIRGTKKSKKGTILFSIHFFLYFGLFLGYLGKTVNARQLQDVVLRLGYSDWLIVYYLAQVSTFQMSYSTINALYVLLQTWVQNIFLRVRNDTYYYSCKQSLPWFNGTVIVHCIVNVTFWIYVGSIGSYWKFGYPAFRHYDY